MEKEPEDLEEAIRTCVRTFYAKARADALLGPIFEATVDDWDVHLRIVADFWSRALLGTDRYKRSPYPVHVPLPLEIEHFSRWLALFEETTNATLPQDLAEKARAKAHHVAASFKAGIFPFTGPDGQPSRHPG
jgi:hemoglobin